MNTASLLLFKALGANAALWREVPASLLAVECPPDVETPFGSLPLSPDCIKSCVTEGGLSLLGALRPVLEAPAFVRFENGGATTFFRAFCGPDGTIGGYVSANVDKGAVSLSVSEHPADIAAIAGRVRRWVIDCEGWTFKSLVGPDIAVTDFDMACAVLGVEPLIRSFAGHKGREGQRGGSLPDAEVDSIKDALISSALPWRHLEYSAAAWDAEFPGGVVNTPIGVVKLGDNQHAKLVDRQREKYFGLIRPTLESPSYVLSEVESDDVLSARRAAGEVPQRASKIYFVRAFVTPDGGHQGFCSVSVSRDGVEVSISSSPKRLNSLARAVRSKAIIAFGSALTVEAERTGSDDGLSKSASCDHFTAFTDGVNEYRILDATLLKAIERYRASHEPTPAQAEAGNYRKRRIVWQGLPITIENEAGSIRSGVDPSGAEWETRMVYPYGYIRESLGVDGDHVDVFLGPDESAPMAYVVHQQTPGGGYDEDKAMLGFACEEDAVRAFLLHYNSEGFLGPVAAIPVADLRTKLAECRGAMLKSDTHEPIPAGARWITVHPGGDGSKGVPILVQETHHGSGTFHVIGGAGGKLNYLKIRGLKSPAEYRQEAAKKQQEKRQTHKQQVARDKELGIHDAKVKAREDIQAQKRIAEREFIKTVADTMGWGEKELEFEAPAGLSEAAAAQGQKSHHQELLKRARQAVDLQRQALISNSESLASTGLGVVPLGLDSPVSDASILTVEDLSPVRQVDGSGINHAFKDRAEKAGVDKGKLAELVADFKAAESGGVEDQVKAAAAVARGEAAQKIRAELAGLPKPDLKPKIAEAQKAVALLKAHKKLLAVQKAAREANKAADNSVVEPKAYVLAVSDVTDADVKKQLEDDVRTAAARTFLDAVDRAGGEDELSGHVFTGACSAIDALSQAVAGSPLIDRSTVDVLGVAGAAQAVARRLRAVFGDHADKIAEGLEEYHAANQTDAVQDALSQAKELQDVAREIEMGEAAGASDLVAAVELSRRRKEALADARKVLGQTLGRQQATAALVMALRSHSTDDLQVSLGKTEPDSAIKQLAALGLDPADYTLGRSGGNMFVTVAASGMDKLAGNVDVENLQRVRRNLAIQNGALDEDNWLPQGFASRPDLALKPAPGVAPSLAEPMDWSHPDREQALRDYIGGRTADGDRAADILADVQSADFFQKSGDNAGYRAALDAVAPSKNGKTLIRAEDLAPKFDEYADAYVQSRWGGSRSTINRQNFEADTVAQDALHRALCDEPSGVAAFKPIAECSGADRRALRDWFYKNVAKESPQQAELREAAERLANDEPERYTVDMFGEQSENPDWQAWQSAYNDAKAKLSSASLDWPRYCKVMGGKVRAIEAVQDLVRSRVCDSFAKHYNTLRPDAALKTGRTVVRSNLNHLSAIDPEEREKRLKQERELIDSLRERAGGKYAAGKVSDKLDAAAEQKAAFEQAQMGFFASDDLFGNSEQLRTEKPLAPDERVTLGHAAENQLGKMMAIVGQNFEPGKPVKLFQPSMSGPDGVRRQRMIKLIEHNKRVSVAAGVGSGKTAISLGAFSHLHSQGKVKKGLFVVPSIVQGQFGAEALRFLEPGRFKWHCQPGASFEDRLASYKDPASHFAVVTHQSFRDDVLRLASMKEGVDPEQITAKLAGMDKPGRAAYMKDVLAHHGINWDYVAADEAHGLLNRDGKENSGMSNAIEGVTDNAEWYAHATGDPTKNDVSEAFSLLQKMDGARYNDRDAFMRRYGGDSRAAKEGLQRELARHQYAMRITPDVKVSHLDDSVPLSDGQRSALSALDKHTASLRIAKMTGKADIAAARAVAPKMFEGVPESQHEAVARTVGDTVGVLRENAIKRVLDNHPDGGKLEAVVKHANLRKGKQGVVFAHSLEAVEAIRARLEKEGHRVATITGKDSSQDKAKKIQAFNPDKGDATADIIVCSDAGATGANLQSGRWLLQYDVPQTAMVHAQRRGRIERVGQKNAIEQIDLIADHELERRARKRMANKYQLRDLMTSPLESIDDTGLAYHLKQAGAI